MTAQQSPADTTTGSGDIQNLEHKSVDEHPVNNDNELKLGLFGQNASYGASITLAERSFEPSIEHSIEVSKLADELGLEMLVPLARWKGMGGQTDFNGQNMEPFTWAATMAQHTDYASVFATVHAPAIHPLYAAKLSTTVDHASNGRFALNVVSGWYTPEIELFGTPQLDHDERYERTHEWTELLKKFWTEQGFGYDGEYYQVDREKEFAETMKGENYVPGGYLRPKPVQRPYPPLMNAGGSEAGQNFAAKHANLAFIPLFDLDQTAEKVKNFERMARDHGRDEDEIQVMSQGLCCVGDTEEEAQQKFERIVDNADLDATENLMNMVGIESETFDPDQLTSLQERFITGWGGYPVVGTPEQVADELVAISETGVSGMLLNFLDYYEELEEFGEKVLPLLEAEGVRTERRGEPVDQ
jgi:alkanesulfonate monooxygenase SsuD/methylene tetrahydromethanopterin reductase-like flavin-dependent oxidoreductase (luciferase family)